MRIETLYDMGSSVLLRIQGHYFISRQVSPESEFCPCMFCHCHNVSVRFPIDNGKKGELGFCLDCVKKLKLRG